MASETSAAGKTILKKPAEERFIVRERHHAIANVARRKDAILAAQPARTAAIVSDGHDRSEIGNRQTLTLRPSSRDVFLQSAQQRGESRAAAHGNHSHWPRVNRMIMLHEES